MEEVGVKDKEAYELAVKLARWLDNAGAGKGDWIVSDALKQATLPATIEWLAEIARRHGFES